MAKFNDRDSFLDALWEHMFKDDEPSDEDQEWFEKKVAAFFDSLEQDNNSNDSGNGSNDSGSSGTGRRRRSGSGTSGAPRRQRRQPSNTGSGGYGSRWFG